MTTFSDRAQFERVMGALFERLMAAPLVAEPLCRTDMVVRFRYPDLGSVLTFDFKSRPAALRRTDELEADVELVQSSDTAHEFWLGRLNAVQAIATGKVRPRGDVAKALKLLPAIKPAFAIYADVARAHALGGATPEGPADPRPTQRLHPTQRIWRRNIRILNLLLPN